MGLIKTMGLGLVIFSMIFIAFFSLFQTMDSGYDYDSGFNYSHADFAYVNESANLELETSYQESNKTSTSFRENTILDSATAYENMIAGGYNVITGVWNYPAQVFTLVENILKGAFDMNIDDYRWFYNGIFTILVLLVLFAILTIIFRSPL